VFFKKEDRETRDQPLQQREAQPHDSIIILSLAFVHDKPVSSPERTRNKKKHSSNGLQRFRRAIDTNEHLVLSIGG
jgi:hypothetical protein